MKLPKALPPLLHLPLTVLALVLHVCGSPPATAPAAGDGEPPASAAPFFTQVAAEAGLDFRH